MTTEIKLLREAEIRDDDDGVVFDFGARGLIVLRIIVDVDGRSVEVIEAVPEHAADWVIELLVDVVEVAVEHTAQVLSG